ncbi:MAG: purine-nucleoside phosphorylase [Saccharofermentanales bacterium]
MDITKYREEIKNATRKIRSKFKDIPEICVVLGSGQSTLADSLENVVELPYKNIPGFPLVTVPGHEGKLISGSLNKVPVLLMNGRFHYYEGHKIESVVFPIRVMLELGMKSIILTNAAGGINKNLNPGDLMIIRDHISCFCESPLRGVNFDEYGTRFPDQSKIYNYEYALNCAGEISIPQKSGVYAYSKGPMFETPAEIRFLSDIGADAVGMSTVPEAIVASHGGMNVTGISCITNYAAGLSNTPLTHAEVLEVGKRTAHHMRDLISEIITKR